MIVNGEPLPVFLSGPQLYKNDQMILRLLFDAACKEFRIIDGFYDHEDKSRLGNMADQVLEPKID
jgi:hypothetical protein